MKRISDASAIGLVLAGGAAVLAYLEWRSLTWPLIHDAPLMHYVAWLIGQGRVPYRDVFDMNLPGVYLIHWALLAVGGGGDLGWRLLDLGWLAATCALLFAYCRPATDRSAAAIAAVLFALYHVSGGAWRAGQRDFFLSLLLLIGAHGVACSAERAGALAPRLWAGLALGAAVTVKPTAALFWALCVAVSGYTAWRAGRAPLTEAGTVLVSGLAVPALVFGWLAWIGGLAAFWAILTGYVLPLYSQLGRVPPWQPFGWYVYGWAVWGLLAGLAALALQPRLRPGAGLRRALALGGVAYGLLHFALQGKGWEYQLYPLALFMCALAAFAVSRAPESSPLASEERGRGRGGRRRPSMQPRLRHAVALVLVAATVMVLAAKTVDAMDASWIANKAVTVSALTADLRRLVPPGGTVQVMDVTGGGIHALYNLGLRGPSRFIYDFHFFHDPGDPRVQALRAELVSALERHPPDAIVVFQKSWLVDGYDRLGQLPGLESLLERQYTRAEERAGYRIYAKRRDT